MKKTYKKALTVATVAAMMTTMVAPAFAANGDFYDNSTNTPYNALSYQTNAAVFNAMITGLILHPDTFVFENNNQEYNYSKMLTAINTQMALGKTVGDAFTMAKADPANVDVKGTTAAVAQSISAVNGTLTVTFDKVVTVAPKATDFVVKKDGVAVTLTDANVTLAAGKVAIQVPTVAATAVDQTVVYSVSYKTGNEIAANVTVLKADSQAAIVAAAETAVKAYETATITTYNDVAAEATLKTAANTDVALVSDTTVSATFNARIATKQTAIDAALLTKVKAVDDANATSQIDLLTSLAFFNNVDANKIGSYDVLLNGTQTTVDQIQLIITTVNNAAALAANTVKDTAAVNASINQIQLLAALRAGVIDGVFTNVNESLIVNYAGTIGVTGIGGKSAVQIQDAITTANTNAVTTAAAAVTAATNAVAAAELAPGSSLIVAAQTLVTALPADVAPAKTKADLQARLTVLAPVAPVLDAMNATNQVALNVALQSSAYVRVNPNTIVGYYAGIASTDNTVAKIQIKIDAANLNAATASVGTAKTTLLTAAKVATAQALVTALPADVAPAKAKADLQKSLDVVNGLLSVDGVVTTFGVPDASVLAVLQSNATVLGLSINPSLATAYKTAILAAGDQTTRDTAGELAAIVNGVNTTASAAAGDAVTAALTNITAAKVATAQALVTALPADVAPITTKVDLQKSLNVVNALLAVDAAVTPVGATDATVLTALQANATVLGLTGTHAVNPNLAYKTAILAAGGLTTRDTASEVVGLVDGVNAQAVIDASAAVDSAALPGLTSAKVATAQALVTKLPTDIAPSVTNKVLQTRLDVVNALLAVDAAITPSSTEATVVAALQANATVLGLTGTSAVNPNLAYKTALGVLTTRDTAVKLGNIVAGVNSPTTALQALATPALTSPAELTLIKAKTLNLTNVIDANATAYFADKVAFATAATVVSPESATIALGRVQNVVNEVNALVQLNVATTAVDAKTAVTTFALNTTNTLYINLSTTEKSELAQMLMADIATNGAYADTTVLTSKITSVNITRTALITAVNDAKTTGTITAMNAALAGLSYAPFNALDASTKLNVAEKFLNSFPMTTATTPVAISYTTITAIEAGIDAAMK